MGHFVIPRQAIVYLLAVYSAFGTDIAYVQIQILCIFGEGVYPMAARTIPVDRPQSIEVWHAAAEHREATGEDQLLAISVTVPVRVPKRTRGDAASAEWPAPLLSLIRPETNPRRPDVH